MMYVRIFIFVLIILSFVTCSVSLSCRKRCQRQRAKCNKLVCPGSFHLDVCGCCKVCSKQETEVCGGTWGEHGRCEVGLKCVRNPGDTFQSPGTCRPIVNGCYFYQQSSSLEIASYGTRVRLEDNTICLCKSRGSWKCRLDAELRVWYDSMEVPYSGDNNNNNNN